MCSIMGYCGPEPDMPAFTAGFDRTKSRGPDDSRVVETADGVTRVKPEQVAVGDTIVVKPGERVPLDGTVLTGTSALNMSALTGESAPVDVAEGSTVVSGSVNLSGVLRLRVAREFPASYTINQLFKTEDLWSTEKSSKYAVCAKPKTYRR